MLNMIKHTWLIFKKTPGYIHTMTTFPIMMLLLITIVLAHSVEHNISVIDNSGDGSGAKIYEALDNIEGLRIIKVSKEEIMKKLLAGNIELAVKIEDMGKVHLVKLSGGSEVENTVKTVIRAVNSNPREEKIQVYVNDVEKAGVSMSYSMGVMLFKFITASSIMAGILIREQNSGMRGRIFLSRTSAFAYLSGKSLVYFGTMCFTALVYYIFCLIFNFDFGMRHSIYFLIMIVVTNVFSVGVFSLLASYLKDEGALWSVSTFIFFPMAIFSGAIFPYNGMPQWMQTVGSFAPQRWISGSIEAIQKYDSISPAIPYIALILVVSLICYFLAVYNIGKKRGAA